MICDIESSYINSSVKCHDSTRKLPLPPRAVSNQRPINRRPELSLLDVPKAACICVSNAREGSEQRLEMDIRRRIR